jgi:cytochrome c553
MKNLAIMFAVLMAWAQYGTAADAAAGKSNAVVCSACHGADGNSAVPSFPKLAGQGEAYLVKQLKDIRDGSRPIPTMAGQLDGKSDEELADLAAYFASQPKSGGKTNPEFLALGAKIFRGGVAERNVAACSACHSPTGKGNAPAGFPSLAGQHAEYTATQLKMYRKGYEDSSGRTNDGDGKIMRTIAFGLSDKEIEAVSSYIAGLK